MPVTEHAEPNPNLQGSGQPASVKPEQVLFSLLPKTCHVVGTPAMSTVPSSNSVIPWGLGEVSVQAPPPQRVSQVAPRGPASPDFLTCANALLGHVHGLDMAVAQQCKAGHPTGVPTLTLPRKPPAGAVPTSPSSSLSSVGGIWMTHAESQEKPLKFPPQSQGTRARPE